VLLLWANKRVDGARGIGLWQILDVDMNKKHRNIRGNDNGARS